MDISVSYYRRFLDEGDEQGLTELIKLYKNGLLFYINGFVNNYSLAEELTENTFVHLFLKKPKYKNLSSFKTWLYTIARNLTIDYLRKNKKKNSREISIELLTDSVSAHEAEHLEESYIKSEDKITVHKAMSKLKSEYREILWLIYFEDLSIKESARILKKSVSNVGTLVHRARTSLKKELEKEGFIYENI